MTDQTNQAVDQALGLLPNGLYLMTAAHGDVRSGILVSAVSRCCDSPNLLCVSARKGHKIDPLIRDSRSFAVGIVDPNDKLITRRFMDSAAEPIESINGEHDDPFDAIETLQLATGAPILARCTTWFDCEVLRRIDLESETELLVGAVVAVLHNGQRMDINRNESNGHPDEGYRSV